MNGFAVYLAAEGFVPELLRELGLPQGLVLGDSPGELTPESARRFVEEGGVLGRLVFRPDPPVDAAWAQNVWRAPFFLEIASIGEAVRALKAIQRNWALYSPPPPIMDGLRRRARLIEDGLPPVSAKPHVFGQPAPTSPLGSWTLLGRTLILASADCSSPFRHGEVPFVEDKLGPPSRAYLKLWEIFTLTGRAPAPGRTCLDLGACPGGWSWVLAGLVGPTGRVVAVDKAPLDPAVAAMPGVESLRESAFALNPARFLEDNGPADWLCSDVICYPERLWRLVEGWMEAGAARNFVCTLKFQGETDFAAMERFAAVPGSRLRHLSCNKHELTWTLFEDDRK